MSEFLPLPNGFGCFWRRVRFTLTYERAPRGYPGMRELKD